ncbi:MAG: hypothetical protein IJ327_03370 [Lachnospiraceae bacterium]|nr:hypothetical protein [Lachnospiraceae bacterium]
MQIYKNLSGNSSVRAFSIGLDYILVQFSTGTPYRYSYRSAGAEKVEQMKKLAVAGSGLGSYINKYARYDYEK